MQVDLQEKEVLHKKEVSHLQESRARHLEVRLRHRHQQTGSEADTS